MACENLGGEDRAVVIDQHADSRMGPIVEHRLVVVVGSFPHQQQVSRWLFGSGQDGGHIFAVFLHLEAFAGALGPQFRADVIDIFAMNPGGSASFQEVLAMGKSEFVESLMAF